MNLIEPFNTTRQLVNRSEGEPEGLADSSVDDVFISWALWLAGALMFVLVMGTIGLDQLPNVFVLTPFWATLSLGIMAQFFIAGSAFFLAKTMRRVAAAQASYLGPAYS